MTTITFKPQNITKILIGSLKERPREVVIQRFGLGSSPKRKTLEAIGNEYGVTRERVRQIENFALDSIRKSAAIERAREAFQNLVDVFGKKGWVVSEKDVLDFLSKDEKTKNHIHFLLVLGDEFTKMKEDEEFHHRWTVDKKMSEQVQDSLRRLHKKIGEDDLISDKEIYDMVKSYAGDDMKKKIDEEIIHSWLKISKIVGQNNFGEWGFAQSANIRPRGMRDLAFLVLRKQGSPMHFSEVAKTISKSFSKSAHPATVHNELIKDKRFVLVGRGLYALADWGYSKGTVRDVIKNILKENGPLPKKDINGLVLKERHVKENTILVNLQNNKYFKRNKEGHYTLV